MAAPRAEHQTVMDPRKLPVAGEYAQALLNLASDDQKAQEILAELDWLTHAMDSIDGFEEMLTASPLSPVHRKLLVERIFTDRLSRECAGLLSLLARKKRLNLLRAIVYTYRQRLDKRRGRIEATVTSALDLDPALLNEIKDALKKLVTHEPVLKLKVDRSLLGGMTIKVGDRLFDASVAGQLRRLGTGLLEKQGAIRANHD